MRSPIRIRTKRKMFIVNEIIKIDGEKWYCYCTMKSDKLRDYIADFYKVEKSTRSK